MNRTSKNTIFFKYFTTKDRQILKMHFFFQKYHPKMRCSHLLICYAYKILWKLLSLWDLRFWHRTSFKLFKSAIVVWCGNLSIMLPLYLLKRKQQTNKKSLPIIEINFWALALITRINFPVFHLAQDLQKRSKLFSRKIQFH